LLIHDGIDIKITIMKSSFIILMFLSASILPPRSAEAQDGWPRTITGSDGSVIQIYAPQPDSFGENKVWFRSAFSIARKGETEPESGSFLALAMLETDRNSHRASLLNVSVLSLIFSVKVDADKMDVLRKTLEREIPGSGMDISLDELVGALCRHPERYKLYVYGELNYTPPRIILASKPSILVLIDGMPRLKWYRDWGVKVVVNTPYTITESEDGWYYLYGGRHWYIAPAATGPYFQISYMPPDMLKAQNAINNANGKSTDTTRESANGVVDIIISTGPAELIQTSGPPSFSAIPGTSLSYVSNSNNDILFDSSLQHYYVLLSGRWFSSPALMGEWKFVASDSLPADFSGIPEGSVKAHVLTSVAGTAEALEALVDAIIPQTARVDRKMVSDTVIYEGAPKFTGIRDTHLQYAVNTSDIVLKYEGNYFYVDRGIWFCAGSPFGPWEVCTKRPEEVNRIPPDYPVYHCKYVYIYDVEPDYVYAGFTPGYINAFIDGPTLVYGTGYYYRPWSDKNYYPRSSTWGFNMWYNPRFGWCLGYSYGLDWLNTGVAWGKGFWPGGWWGPSIYRPPYVGHH
jgi:hypothetical protein